MKIFAPDSTPIYLISSLISRLITCLITGWVLITSPLTVLAGPIHETFFQSSVPTLDQIEEWSKLPGERSYLLQLQDPRSWDLEPLLHLRGADRIRIEVTHFPGHDTIATWKKLAAQGSELIGLGTGLPTEDEIARLNLIGFSHIALVLGSAPGQGEGARLTALKTSVALTFAMKRYPKFVEKPLFMEIPSSTPLLFVAGFWPRYIPMDVLNLLPHPKRIRVEGLYPTDQDFEYLKNIHTLEEVTVDADFAPAHGDLWSKFGTTPVRWRSRNSIPLPKAFADFVASSASGGKRMLSLDQDEPLTARDRARLESSPIAVEWTHAAGSR